MLINKNSLTPESLVADVNSVSSEADANSVATNGDLASASCQEGRHHNDQSDSKTSPSTDSCQIIQKNHHGQESNNGGQLAETKPSSHLPNSSLSDQAANSSSFPGSQLGIKSETVGAQVDQDDLVTIIHFNDCYNVEPGPHSSGAAGFLTAVNEQRHLNPMILFSGDIISPSFMSTFTKGEQMIPVLNDIRVDCAVFGNHEFDYGVDNLIDFVKRTTFPWLLSNVVDKETSNQLGEGQVFHIMERSGLKFGLIGLIEEEWLSTLSTIDSSDVIYQDFVTRGRELASWLKSEPHNVDYVIALTHFRTPNDIRLADSVPEIDLILGGHDHDYEIIKRPNCYIIKSGTDFREFSKITLKINSRYMELERQQLQTSIQSSENQVIKPFLDLQIEHVKCLTYKPNEELKKKLDKFVTTIDEKMDKVLGQFNCELDGRFSSIRRGETNLGNFVTDIMLASTHSDLAILNSGTLRSDRIHPRGDFTMRDLFSILGYIDPIAVLESTGQQIWRALENGVSQWPRLEGRFPQISGCSFAFDPSKPPMQRIDPKDITIGDEPLVLDRLYRLTTKAYLASGKDGYDMLKDCQVLVPGDESPDLTTSILNHFEAINIVKSNRRTHHRQSIICMSRTSLMKIMDHCSNHCISHSEEAAATPITAPLSGAAVICSPQTQLPAAATATYTGHPSAILCDSSSGPNASHHLHLVSVVSESDELEASTARQEHHDSNNNKNNCSFDGGRSNEHHRHHHGDAGGCNFLASSPIEGTTAPAPSFGRAATVGSAGESGGEPFTCGTSLPGTAPTTIQRKPRTKRLMSLYEIEHEQCKLEPKIEGRIRVLGVNA